MQRSLIHRTFFALIEQPADKLVTVHLTELLSFLISVSRPISRRFLLPRALIYAKATPVPARRWFPVRYLTLLHPIRKLVPPTNLLLELDNIEAVVLIDP